MWHPLHATGFSGLALSPRSRACIFVQASGLTQHVQLYIPQPARGVCGIQCSHPSEGQRPYQGQPLPHRSRYGSCQICWAASACVRRSVYSTWPLRSGLPSIMHGMTMMVKLLIWSNHPDPSLQRGVLKKTQVSNQAPKSTSSFLAVTTWMQNAAHLMPKLDGDNSES